MTLPVSGGRRSGGFRRSLGTRFLAIVCAPVLVSAAASYAASYGLTAWGAALAGMALLSLGNLVTAWGDRFVIGEAGIEYRNAILAFFGRKPRQIGWDDVVALREHHRLRAGRPEERPTALFLTLRSGRRMVLDSLENLDQVITMIRDRCGRNPGRDGGSGPGGDRADGGDRFRA